MHEEVDSVIYQISNWSVDKPEENQLGDKLDICPSNWWNQVSTDSAKVVSRLFPPLFTYYQQEEIRCECSFASVELPGNHK